MSAPVLCFSPGNAPDARTIKNLQKAGILTCVVPDPDRVISLHAAPVMTGDIMARAALLCVQKYADSGVRNMFGREVLRLHMEALEALDATAGGAG